MILVACLLLPASLCFSARESIVLVLNNYRENHYYDDDDENANFRLNRFGCFPRNCGKEMHNCFVYSRSHTHTILICVARFPSPLLFSSSIYIKYLTNNFLLPLAFYLFSLFWVRPDRTHFAVLFDEKNPCFCVCLCLLVSIVTLITS